MKRILIFYINLVKRILLRNKRFIRLTPNTIGQIKFYDVASRRFFSVHSRGPIDSATADQIYTNHDYDISFLTRSDELLRTYKGILANGKRPLIIDCGANIGLSARYFAEEFPDAMIVAIEPDSSNIQSAKDNCSGISNIDLRTAAIGSVRGHVQICNPNGDSNAFQTIRSDASDSVAVLTIEDIMSEFENSQLFLAKIDIEGFEEDLFKKNTEWVDKCSLLIVELHDWLLPNSANSRNLLKAISSTPRDFVFKGENIFSIRND